MTSIALARKWRPKSFSTLIGQDHVALALIHSLENARLHHAYLFTGTRGVGKTTIGRLFAKALNCEKGLSSNPCLRCDTCLAIDEGAYVDLIEIDAASNTRVEDVRELLDNVPYAPTVGRYKVYLIDEVHMLSQHSFNALLKTLEEPPAHVKFLLATTDPQKLPATILSRCLQFHLKPISTKLIAEQLKFILKEENLTHYEEEAIQLLAKTAQGSMRDALSLLDQAIAGGQGVLSLSVLESQLSLTQTRYAEEIIESLARRNPEQLMRVSTAIASKGGNYEKILQDLIFALHQLCLSQVLDSASSVFDETRALLKYQHAFTAEELQLLYQIALKGSQDILITPTLAIGFEMTLLRMHTFMPATEQPRRLPEELSISVQEKASLESIDSPNITAEVEKKTEKTKLTTSEKIDVAIEITEPEPIVQETQPNQDISLEPTETTDSFQGFEFQLFDDLLPIDEIDLPSEDVTISEILTQDETTNISIEPMHHVTKATRTVPTEWSSIISALELKGLAQAAVEHASLVSFDKNSLILGVSSSHRSLFTPAVLKKIEESVFKMYAITVKISLQNTTENQLTPAKEKAIQQDENRQKAFDLLLEDPQLNTIKQVFSAEIRQDSVELLKDGI